MPQLNQQKENQDAQLQLQRDINSGTINQNKAIEDYYNNLGREQIAREQIKKEALKGINFNDLPQGTDYQKFADTIINNALYQNPAYQEIQGDLARSMVQSGLNNKNTNTLQGEIQIEDPLSGATIKYKGNQSQIDSIKNSIASAKK
jgi:hypothetical protein